MFLGLYSVNMVRGQEDPDVGRKMDVITPSMLGGIRKGGIWYWVGVYVEGCYVRGDRLSPQ